MTIRKPEKGLEVQFQRHLPAGSWNKKSYRGALLEDVDNELFKLFYNNIERVKHNDLVITVSFRPFP